jgi:hypothetical protein
MRTAIIFLVIHLLFPCISIKAEPFRTIVEGNIEINAERPAGSTIPIGINSSVLLSLGQDTRFIRGIEIEINTPQSWLAYRGSLVMAVYNNTAPQTASGIIDIDGNQIAFEPLPSKLQIIYQIPIRQPHGLRTTTSITVQNNIALPVSFPILFRLIPVIKGMSVELENMIFNFSAKPIYSDEGALRLITRYPLQLNNRPFSVLIDDNVISNIQEQIVLREGEHHLVILSDDFRNESRRFIIERSKIIDLIIELQDTTPILIFEGPQNAAVYLNNARINNIREPVKVQPGSHEVRFQVGDYTVIQTLTIQRGKTYRIALNIDLVIQEED